MERWYRATGVVTRTIVRALDVRLRLDKAIALLRTRLRGAYEFMA